MSFIDSFEKNCITLLKKMNSFEENFFCEKCKSAQCKHLQKEKQKKFKKDIKANLQLATKVADKVTEIRTQELYQPLAY